MNESNTYRARLRAQQLSLPAIQDPATNWFDGWYLDLRLEEEVARANRYNLHLTLLVFVVQEPIRSETDSRLLNELLRDMAARKLRRTDLPAVVGNHVYAVSLPHTNPNQANVVATRLRKGFAPFTVKMGLASYPEDAEESERLLDLAESRALSSSQVAMKLSTQ